jgi:hypothetical protein
MSTTPTQSVASTRASVTTRKRKAPPRSTV